MTHNFEIKIIKLKTGEDIIGFINIDVERGFIIVKYPKLFYYSLNVEEDAEELVLIDWLPRDAYAVQEACLPRDHVLVISYPVIEFGYQYLAMMKDELEPDSKLAQDIEASLTEGQVPDGTSIH